MATLDLVRRQFGRLRVTKFFGVVMGQRRWECKCRCGGETILSTRELTSGKIKRCDSCRTGEPA